jgi:hypothetical protein
LKLGIVEIGVVNMASFKAKKAYFDELFHTRTFFLSRVVNGVAIHLSILQKIPIT